MTLYYNLVFALLITEMATTVFFILPLPRMIKRSIFQWTSNSPLAKNLEYWLRIVFVFVFILFADSLNRLLRTSREIAEEHDHHHHHDVRDDQVLHMRMFYAQRNVYLTGFTLFLSIVLARLQRMLLNQLKCEEDLEILKKQATNQSTSHLQLIEQSSTLQEEIDKLQMEMAECRQKARDFDALKKQAENATDEYMRLMDRYNALEARVEQRSSEVRKDV